MAAKKKANNPKGIGQGKGKRPNAVTITNKVIDDLLAWLAQGLTIRAFCAKEKVSRTQVHERLKDPQLAEPLARAKEIGEQEILDEMCEIADGRDKSDPDDIQRRKLQLWMREKRLVWSNQAKYGAKTQVESGGVNILVVTGVVSPPRDNEESS